MEDNKVLDELLDKVPQVKEAVEKVENATGKKIEDIASEVGKKITDAVKDTDEEDAKGAIGEIANKLFGKK